MIYKFQYHANIKFLIENINKKKGDFESLPLKISESITQPFRLNQER